MYTKLFAITALVGGLLACTDSGKDGDTGGDTGGVDTGGLYDGPVLVMEAKINCPAGGSATTAFARTRGISFGADLIILETGSSEGFDEAHTLDPGDEGPNLWWGELGRTLSHTSTLNGVSDGVSLFNCDYYDGSSLTYAIEVFGAGSTREDCVLWGHNPSSVKSGGYYRANLFGGGSSSRFADCDILQ